MNRLFVAACLVLIADPAHADPIITPLVVGAIGSSLASTVVVGSLTVGALVSTVVQGALAIGASILLAPKHKGGADPYTPQPPTVQNVGPQSISPRYYGFGRLLAGGIRHLYESADGRHLVSGFVLNCEPIDGFEVLLCDGEQIPLNYSTSMPELSSPINGVLVTTSFGKLVIVPNAGLKFQFVYTIRVQWDGKQFTQQPYPIGFVPIMAFEFCNGLPTGNPSAIGQTYLGSTFWGSDKKCVNLACLYHVAIGSQIIVNRFAAYPKGIPEVSAIIRGAKIFDPRDGMQSFGDPTTWLWSRNAALVLAWYMTHYDGGKIPEAKIDWPSFAAAATYCDRPVLKWDGVTTEPWARSDGQWHAGEAVRDVMARLQAACDATVWEDGAGLWHIWIAQNVTPTVTLGDLDIADYQIEDLPAALDEVNFITASYTDPRENYQVLPAAPVKNNTSIAAVGERSNTITLKEAQSPDQAYRIAYRVLMRESPAERVTITGGPSLLRTIGEFVVGIDSPAAGLSGTYRITERAKVSGDGEAVSLSLALVSAHDYDDVIAPYDPVSPHETSVAPPPVVIPVATPDAPTLIEVLISGEYFINITATIGGVTPPDPSLVYYAEIWQVDPGTHARLGPSSIVTNNISEWIRQSDAVTDGDAYEVAGWFIQNGNPGPLSASSFITITTIAPPAVPTPDAPTVTVTTSGGLDYLNAEAKISGATPTDPTLTYYAEARQVDPITHVAMGAFGIFPVVISTWVRQSNPEATAATYEVLGWFVQGGTRGSNSASTFITI